jgi:LAO/AO transport system kinase
LSTTANDDLTSRVLAAEPRAIARMMSLAEGPTAKAAEALSSLTRHTGKAQIVGITGVPGSGKSTLVQALTKELRRRELKIGIVAVDPSSPYSGGAILGDRVRMTELTTDPGVFIRSLATRGALGGLARAALDTVDVLDAAGFDIVLIETVGVGQDEVDIAEAADTVLVVSAPGLGDGIQAIKAGVLEIADIHVVTKADKTDAPRTIADLSAMLKIGSDARERFGWEVPVLSTSAQTGQGISDLADRIADHSKHLTASGEGALRRRQRVEARILKAAQALLAERLAKATGLEAAVDKTLAGDMSVGEAAAALLENK